MVLDRRVAWGGRKGNCGWRPFPALAIGRAVAQSMGYYARVLTTKESCISLVELTAALKESGSRAVIQSDADVDPDDWEQIILSHADGVEIASIERNVVEDDSLGQEEVEEFTEALDDTMPQSAAAWLRKFLPRVRCIYSFQHLSGTEVGDGFEALSSVRSAIWRAGTSILQADGEGFSYEDGDHITCEFSDSVKGDWWMGVLDGGKWVHFQMDLGDPAHRKAFKSGRIPSGVRRA